MGLSVIVLGLAVVVVVLVVAGVAAWVLLRGKGDDS